MVLWEKHLGFFYNLNSVLICVFFLLSVGLERILKLLSSEDIEVQMHALKVVANLAAEGNLFCS